MRPTKDGKRRRTPPRIRRDGDAYACSWDGREVRLFDPRRCLKVGRHYGRLGIVYVVEVPGGTLDNEGNWHASARGLLSWTPGEPETLSASAARMAWETAGVSRPSSAMADGLVKAWDAKELWERLDRMHELGEVCEIMSE